MEALYDVNGLMFWSEREIRLRNQFAEHFAAEMKDILLAENPAWRFIQVEAPLLTPRKHLNKNYTVDDVWVQDAPELFEQYDDPFYNTIANLDNLHPENAPHGLALRPETTPGSYIYAEHLMKTHSGVKPPFVVWQTGKSFRREQDQVTKNMRLKEFYQQEFQCFYTADTKNDYHAAVLEPVRKMIEEVVGKPSRIVESDRLPDYSEITMDVELQTESYIFNEENDQWMEVCSISRRTDFPVKARFQGKKGMIEKDLMVLEVAIGLDRCVYNFEQKGTPR